MPSAAIDRRMSQPAVIRVRNNVVERVPVTLGIIDDRNDRVEITGGVQGGDVLLAGASQQLAPGTHVEIDAVTTLALIAGMIPVALGTGEGADFRAPLGRAVIGGTITSTMLTLLVIPTIYEILSEVREWLGRKFHRHAAEPQPSTASG